MLSFGHLARRFKRRSGRFGSTRVAAGPPGQVEGVAYGRPRDPRKRTLDYEPSPAVAAALRASAAAAKARMAKGAAKAKPGRKPAPERGGKAAIALAKVTEDLMSRAAIRRQMQRDVREAAAEQRAAAAAAGEAERDARRAARGAKQAAGEAGPGPRKLRRKLTFRHPLTEEAEPGEEAKARMRAERRLEFMRAEAARAAKAKLDAQAAAAKAALDAGGVDIREVRRKSMAKLRGKVAAVAAWGGGVGASSGGATDGGGGVGPRRDTLTEADVESHIQKQLDRLDPWEPDAQLSPRSRRKKWREDAEALAFGGMEADPADPTDLAAIVRRQPASRVKNRPLSMAAAGNVKYKLSRRYGEAKQRLKAARAAKAAAGGGATATAAGATTPRGSSLEPGQVPGVLVQGETHGADVGEVAEAAGPDVTELVEAGDEGPFALGWDDETPIVAPTGPVSWLDDNELVDLAAHGEWVEPDLAELQGVNARKKFATGAAPICNFSLTTCARKKGAAKLSNLGEGMVLYFNFLFMASVALFVMSLLCVPALMMCMEGTGIHTDDMDPLYVATTTIGNIGHPSTAFTCFNDTDDYKFDIDLVEEATIQAQTIVSGAQQQFRVVFTHDEAECSAATNTSVVTAYTVNFQGQQWLLTDAAVLISQLDVAATGVFLALCIYLAINIRRASAAANAEVVTVADYAVRVTGLPPRTTKADLRRHFDALYNPTRRSWYTPGYCFGCYRSHRSREAPVVIDPRAEFTSSLTPAQAKMKKSESQRRSQLWFPPQPVDDVSHRHSDPYAWAYKNSWVASVTLIKSLKYSHALSSNVEAVHSRLLLARKRVGLLRSKARRAREDSLRALQQLMRRDDERKEEAGTAWGAAYKPHHRTRQLTKEERQFAAAEERVDVLEGKLRKLVKQVARVKERARAKYAKLDEKREARAAKRAAKGGGRGRGVSGKLSLFEADDAQEDLLDKEAEALEGENGYKGDGRPCLGAFVVFQEEESFLRCIEDYSTLSGGNCCTRRFTPRSLLFKARTHELLGEPPSIIHVEPAPEPSNIMFHNLDLPPSERLARRCISACVLLGQKSAVAKRIPSDTVCDVTLPTASYQSAAFPTDARLTRNRTADAVCGGDMVFLYYRSEGKPDLFSTAQDIVHVGSPEAQAWAPTEDTTCRATCVSPSDDSVTCSTPAADASLAHPQATVPASVKVSCYCKAALAASIATYGAYDGTQRLLDASLPDSDADVCADYAALWLSAQGYFVLAAVSVPLINAIVKTVIKRLARFERHDTRTVESVRVSKNIFLLQYVNTAVIVALTNARLPAGLQLPIQGTGLFEGDFDGFTRKWYAYVGSSLITTMLVNTVAPHIGPLFRDLVLFPIRARLKLRKAVSQTQLNNAMALNNFDIAARYPAVLMCVFVCFTFSAGMPLLAPIGFVSVLLFYWVEKFLLLRTSLRPPRFDEKLATLATTSLPYAALLHSAMAVWMYSEPRVLLTEKHEDLRLLRLLAVNDPIGWTDRVLRKNATPFVLLTLLLVLWGLAGKTLVAMAKRVLYAVTAGAYGDTDIGVEDMREHNPSFTGVFKRYLSPQQARAAAAEADRAAAGAAADVEEEFEPAPMDCQRLLACQCASRSQLEYFNAAQVKAARDKKRALERELAMEEGRALNRLRRQAEGGIAKMLTVDEIDDGEGKEGPKKVGGAGLAEETFDPHASDSGDSNDSALFAGVLGADAAIEAAKERAAKRARRREAEKEKRKKTAALRKLLEPPSKWVDLPAPGGYVLRTRMWTRKGELDGVPHEKGDALRTWEVIAVSGTAYSYDLEQQAEYATTALIEQQGDLGATLAAKGDDFELRDSLFPPQDEWKINPLIFLDPLPPPTPPPPTSPPQPPVITHLSSASRVVSVRFRAPDNDGGKRITSYTTWLVYNDPETGAPMMLGREYIQIGHPDLVGPPPASFAVDFTELTNGYEYKVNLVATNIEGRSNIGESEPVIPSAKPNPVQPHQIRHTVTPGGLRLAWDPIEINGAPLERVTLYITHVPLLRDGQIVSGSKGPPQWVTKRVAAAEALAAAEQARLESETAGDGVNGSAAATGSVGGSVSLGAATALDDGEDASATSEPPELLPHPLADLDAQVARGVPGVRLNNASSDGEYGGGQRGAGRVTSRDRRDKHRGRTRLARAVSASMVAAGLGRRRSRRDGAEQKGVEGGGDAGSGSDVSSDGYDGDGGASLSGSGSSDDDTAPPHGSDGASEPLPPRRRHRRRRRRRSSGSYLREMLGDAVLRSPDDAGASTTAGGGGSALSPAGGSVATAAQEAEARASAFLELITFPPHAEHWMGLNVDVGATSHTFTDLVSGDEYWYIIEAQNLRGVTRSCVIGPVIPKDRPDPVRHVHSGRLDEALRITWDAPLNERGSPIRHYDVSVYFAATSALANAAKRLPPATRSVDIGGLRNGFAYLANVAAVNGMGASRPALAPHEIPAGVPFPPSQITATPFHDADGKPAALVQFSRSRSNGRAVLRYFVHGMAHRWTAGREAEAEAGSVLLRMVTTEQAADRQDPLIIATLKRDAEAVGRDVDSTGVPAGVSVDGDGDSTADGDPNAGGNLQWAAAAAHSGANDELPCTCLVPGLVLGGFYRFRVWAENEVGVGARGEWSEELCAIALATPPRSVAAVPGHREADITWVAPVHDGGAPILEYIVIPQRDDGEDAGRTVRVPGSARGVRMTSLSSGVTYRFVVRAVNAVGIGPASEPSDPMQTMLGMFSPSRVHHIVHQQRRLRGKRWYDGYEAQVGVTILGEKHAAGVVVDEGATSTPARDAKGAAALGVLLSSKDVAPDGGTPATPARGDTVGASAGTAHGPRPRVQAPLGGDRPMGARPPPKRRRSQTRRPTRRPGSRRASTVSMASADAPGAPQAVGERDAEPNGAAATGSTQPAPETGSDGSVAAEASRDAAGEPPPATARPRAPRRPKFQLLHLREENVEYGASPFSPASWGFFQN